MVVLEHAVPAAIAGGSLRHPHHQNGFGKK